MENNIFYANLMSIVYRLHFNDKKDPIHKQYLVKLNLSVGCPMDPLYTKFIVHWLYCGRWSSINSTSTFRTMSIKSDRYG